MHGLSSVYHEVISWWWWVTNNVNTIAPSSVLLSPLSRRAQSQLSLSPGQEPWGLGVGLCCQVNGSLPTGAGSQHTKIPALLEEAQTTDWVSKWGSTHRVKGCRTPGRLTNREGAKKPPLPEVEWDHQDPIFVGRYTGGSLSLNMSKHPKEK